MEDCSILVIGAGLRWSGVPHHSPVIVDKEGAAVCKHAAALFAKLQAHECKEEQPTVFVTAGISPTYYVCMNEVYKKCLIAHGVPETRINTAFTAKAFNTRGEAEAFPTLDTSIQSPARTHAVHVIDRDFHMRRTIMLLRAQLTSFQSERTTFHAHPVPSDQRLQNLIREPLALMKDSFYACRRQHARL
ncbi:MAG: hypothetical protein JWL88_435 [Parcubacteria group bacterium]|nr:hypothetical protein [Parcubacteria group bacterium]